MQPVTSRGAWHPSCTSREMTSWKPCYLGPLTMNLGCPQPWQKRPHFWVMIPHTRELRWLPHALPTIQRRPLSPKVQLSWSGPQQTPREHGGSHCCHHQELPVWNTGSRISMSELTWYPSPAWGWPWNHQTVNQVWNPIRTNTLQLDSLEGRLRIPELWFERVTCSNRARP